MSIVEELKEANSAAFAIKHLGRLLADSKAHAGYESIDSSQWAAIGIAIEFLAAKIEFGALSLEDISE